MKSSTGNKIPEHAAPRLPVFYQPLWPNLHCTINSEFNITSFTSVFSVQCSLFGVYNPPIKSAILLSVEKSLAIAILLWNNPDFEYNEPILEPIGYQMRKIRPQKTVAKQIIKLKLYPNPAKDYFTVFYKVPDAFRNSLSLQVKDATRRIVLQQSLPDNALEYMIDTGTLTKGVYTVVLLNNNSLLKAEKLVIIK